MKSIPLGLIAAAVLAFAPLPGLAQSFPDKPITFLVPFAAGTATDQIARALGNAITAETKQPVVIDNKAGASGFIASQQVAKAAADGYTVLITTNTTHAANEHLFKKLPYDPVNDYAPVAALGKGGQIMVVNPAFPARTVAEFVALAKKEPGKYSFGSGSSSSRMAGELLQQLAGIQLLHVPYKSNTLAVTDLLGGQIMVVNPALPAKSVTEFVELARKEPGKRTFGSGSSSSRIAGELFQQMADVKLVHVPYKSNPMAVTDLLGGQIDMMITDAATGLPQVRSGKLRALGVSSSKRSPLAPDVPTIDEAGVKGYEMGYWFGAYVPAGTPAEVVKRLNGLLVHAVGSPEARSFYESTGTEPVSGTPDELARFQAAEAQKWGKIIKAAGIEAE